MKNKIFAPGLKFSVHYIACLLLAVFMVTLMPFNLLHRHAEDEHQAVLMSHEEHPSHHCELDNHFCQPQPDEDCGHESHIQEALTKCFSCEFHFIKHFDQERLSPELFLGSGLAGYPVFFCAKLHQAVVLQSNKGPPSVV